MCTHNQTINHNASRFDGLRYNEWASKAHISAEGAGRLLWVWHSYHHMCGNEPQIQIMQSLCSITRNARPIMVIQMTTDAEFHCSLTPTKTDV